MLIATLLKLALFGSCVIYAQKDKDLGKNSNQVIKFTRTAEPLDDPAPYQFVVSIVINDKLTGVGACIRANWVLTAFSFFDSNVTKYHHVTVLSWDATMDGSGKGQEIAVDNMFIHPDFDEEICNYDAVLLKLKVPFNMENVIAAPLYKETEVPAPKTSCVVVVPYKGVIKLKKFEINGFATCSKHKEYASFTECPKKNGFICFITQDGIVGAPLVCNEKLIGVLPSNMDTDTNQTILQTAQSYYEWTESIASDILLTRSSVAGCVRLKKIFIFMLVSIPLMRTVIYYVVDV